MSKKYGRLWIDGNKIISRIYLNPVEAWKSYMCLSKRVVCCEQTSTCKGCPYDFDTTKK